MAQRSQGELHEQQSDFHQITKNGAFSMDLTKIVRQLSAGYGAMLDRALHGAAMPVANATSSYWMDKPPWPEVNLNQKQLPDIADYVIIGTGLTGLAATRTVLEISQDQRTEMPLRVVALEARDICAGATGRNGGHIKSTPHKDFATLKEVLGGAVDKARDTLRFMRSHVDMLKEVGQEVPQGEVREVETVDLFLEEKDFEDAKVLVDDLKANVPEIEVNVLSGQAACEKYGTNDAVAGAISYSAGAAFPFRLVTGGWKRLLDKYPELVLLSNTPVETISIAQYSPQHPYAIQTSKGTVRTRHVLHATNAYTPNLVPRLRSSLTGARGCMTAQDGGTNFPRTGGYRSWSIVKAPGFDYVTQRPDKCSGPGAVMVGGGFRNSSEQGIDLLGVWDDSERDELPLDHVRGIMSTVFKPNWGGGDSPTAGGVKKDWTGIMGFTGDTLPFVGPLPQSISERKNPYPTADVPGIQGSGEWIAAGFNGHGMVWSWLSGAAAAIMMAAKDKADLPKAPGRPSGTLDSWFPRDVVALDEERLKRADLKNLEGRL